MSELYTVPAKTNVQTKVLISAFEKGEVQTLTVDDEVKPVRIHPELIDGELAESGIAKKLLQAFQEERLSPKLHPEMSAEELAEPGTAKKLLLAFETKRKVSQNSSPLKSPSSAGVKLTKEKFETESKQVAVNGLVNGNSDESLTIKGNGSGAGAEDEIKITKVEVSGTSSARHSVDDTATITVTSTTVSVDQNNTFVTEENKFKEEKVENQLCNDVIVTTNTEVIVTSVTSPEAVSSVQTVQESTRDVKEEVVDKIEVRVAEEKKEEKTEEKAAEIIQEKVAEKKVDENVAEVTLVHKSEDDATVSVTALDIQVAAAASTYVPRKNVLIVRAVREETPLDVALLDSTLRTLTSEGHVVSVTNVFKLSPEQSAVEEYKKLQGSDLIVFLYRTVLNSFPAALKAWLENVLIQNDGHHIDKVALKGKRAVLLVTTDVDKSDEGSHTDIAKPLQAGVLRLVSLEVLPPLIIFGATKDFDEGEKNIVLDQWCSRLTTIWDEKAL